MLPSSRLLTVTDNLWQKQFTGLFLLINSAGGRGGSTPITYCFFPYGLSMRVLPHLICFIRQGRLDTLKQADNVAVRIYVNSFRCRMFR